MSDTLALTPVQGTWVVRVGGAVLGETTRALSLTQADDTALICFPRDDIGMAFLEPTETGTKDAATGDVQFFSIMSKSKTYENAAWSYDAPEPNLSALKGYLAFKVQDGVAVEQV